jgi:hypothetical protein
VEVSAAASGHCRNRIISHVRVGQVATAPLEPARAQDGGDGLALSLEHLLEVPDGHEVRGRDGAGAQVGIVQVLVDEAVRLRHQGPVSGR